MWGQDRIHRGKTRATGGSKFRHNLQSRPRRREKGVMVNWKDTTKKLSQHIKQVAL